MKNSSSARLNHAPDTGFAASSAAAYAAGEGGEDSEALSEGAVGSCLSGVVAAGDQDAFVQRARARASVVEQSQVKQRQHLQVAEPDALLDELSQVLQLRNAIAASRLGRHDHCGLPFATLFGRFRRRDGLALRVDRRRRLGR